MSRKRHQAGQLIRTKHGWAMRYYEQGEGERCRVQKFLGTFEELTKPQARTAMQAALATVNEHPVAPPKTSTTTFRTFAEHWIEDCEQRKQKPIKPSVSHNWRCILDNHLYEPIGDLPLASVGNKTMRSLVERLAKKKLAPSTIRNICLVVKLVVASVTDEDGNRVHLREWNRKFIDAPEVENQHTPSFIGEQVTKIVAAATGRLQMIVILLAATGLRMGELTGLECKHFDGESVKVEQAVWAGNGAVGKPKTKNAYRVIDLHPDVAALLKTFIGRRTTGFIFRTSSGRPLAQSNILRREFHPLLDSLKIDQCGFHAFRRFRNTHLRNSLCPDGLLKFWMGHSAKDMSDHYDKVRDDVQFRRDVAKSLSVGFQLPTALTPKEKTSQSGVIPPIGRQEELEVVPC
jgi:integrase